MLVRSKRDLVGGVLIAAFGVVGVLEGQRLGSGSLAEIGPGFMPRAVGSLLMLLGLLMMRGEANPEQSAAIAPPDWRGWFCIILGVASFIALGPYVGLVPAAFSCVFISAIGDRQMTIKAAFLLAAGITVLGVLVFHSFLHLNIPLFGGLL